MPYPPNSYKNAPNHSPPGQHWKPEINAVYNACMREGNGDKSKCARIAWSQYHKTVKNKGHGTTQSEGEKKEKGSSFMDSNGGAMQPGSWYVMHSPNHKVPDVIHIVSIDDHHIEAAIEGDDKVVFPLRINTQDIDSAGYSFEPYTESEAVNVEKIAHSQLSMSEQRELVEESTDLLARNLDKLNLEGTHYSMGKNEEDITLLFL